MIAKLFRLIRWSVALLTLLVAINLFIAPSVKYETADRIDTDTLKTIKPKNQYTIENQLITTILSRYHYNRFELNDSISSVILDRYIKALDYGKSFFYASDIKAFEKYKNTLDDSLTEGNVEPFYTIFNIYIERMAERISYIDTILSKDFDYSTNDSVEVERKDADWIESYSQMNDLWFKRVKSDALNLKLNGKNWDEIVSNLSRRYENYSRTLSQYNSEDVFQIAMDTYASSLDPHTNYLSPVSSENFKIDMSLSLEGIGARLMSDDGYTKVVEIIPGGPAFKSKKLKVNDRIVAVAQDEDGEFVDVIGWRITDVVQLIRGPKETVVRLQIIPAENKLDSKPEVISLVRDKVKLEEQAAKSEVKEITNAGLSYRIGVITIPKFYTDFEGQRNGESGSKSTVTDVKKILEDLKAENVDGIVIDLRNNGGGSLTEAIDVTGLFIKKGPVVQVKNMDSSVDIGEDPDPSIVYDGPLAVLVNRFSASASEIFAGAIQDYERGIIIGESTYGKGTVQNLIDLNRLASANANQFGQVKLTIAKYYRINGGSTQELGVKPDIPLPSYFDPEEYSEASEPNALPWDQIGSTNYVRVNDFSKLIPELQHLSEERRKDNPEFSFIEDDIAEYKKSKEDNFVSLNENVRKLEKDLDEERQFQRENERRKIKGLVLLQKGETPPEDEEIKEENDLFLDETEMIVTDMIRISGELTHLPKN